MCRDLETVRQSISAYARAFDAASLTAWEAGRVVELCTVIEASISTLKSLAAARLAGSGTWKHEGYRNAEEQLADRSGTGTGQARRTLTNAKRLSDHPDVAHAALNGELSVEQAALVAAGAEADPTRTAGLIDKAKTSTLGELRDEVAQVRAVHLDREAERRRIHQARKLRSYTDIEGVWHLLAAGNVEDGITITRILTPIRQRLNRLRRDRGHELQPFEQLDYDALITLAQIAGGRDSELSLTDLFDLGLFPQHDFADRVSGPARTSVVPAVSAPPVTADSHGRPPAETANQSRRDRAAAPAAERITEDLPEPMLLFGRSCEPSSPTAAVGSSTPPTKPPPPASGDDRGGITPPGEAPAPVPRSPKLAGRPLQLIIRVDLDTLLRGVAIEGELCEIPGYGPIPVSLIRDLKANDNVFVSAVLTKSKQIIGVYRDRRRPNLYQQTALDFLYPTCAAAGCNRKAGLEYEHRQEWSKTHYTVYDLMDRLCWHHHQQKTHQGWKLVNGSGKRPFVPPTDPRHPDHQEQLAVTARKAP